MSDKVLVVDDGHEIADLIGLTEPHTYLAVKKLSIDIAVVITRFFFDFIDELPLWYVATSGNNGSSGIIHPCK